MSGIESIVEVNIQLSTRTPSRPGFGIPLIVGYTSNTLLPRVKSYSDLATLESDGYALTSPIYLMAAAMMAQSPRVQLFKVGRLNTAPVNTIKLIYTEATPTTGRSVSVTINGVTATYVVQASDTISLVHTGLATAINALSNTSQHTAVGAAGQVTMTATATGGAVRISEANEYLQILDTTVVGTAPDDLATDLSLILAADRNWHYMVTDSRSEVRIKADAAFALTAKKMYIAQTSDTEVSLEATTTDVASDLVTLANTRVDTVWSKDTSDMKAAALVGAVAPLDPGTYSLEYKTLAGVTADAVTASMETAFATKRVTYYTTISGINVTIGGQTSDGGFTDNTLTVDWLVSEIEATSFALLINNPKIPFTDEGIRMISDGIKNVLQRGEDLKPPAVANTPKFYVSSPKALDIASADRVNRVLNKIEFSARLAGAIRKVRVFGTLTV